MSVKKTQPKVFTKLYTVAFLAAMRLEQRWWWWWWW